MHSRLTLAAAVALALSGSAASAAGIDDMFSIRGFGTIGGVYSTQDQADFVRDVYAQPEGAGHTDQLSTAVDSKSAIQLDAVFTERLSGVIQLVSEGSHNNSWDKDPNNLWRPSLEWANLKYRVTDSFSVRGGRVVAPVLMNSEFKKVGYAQHWMRNPVEVYGKIPVSSIDGVDLSFTHGVGGGQNTVRLLAGVDTIEAEGPDIDGKSFGIVDDFQVGSWNVHFAYMTSNSKQEQVSERTAPFYQMANAFELLRTFGIAAAEASAAQARKLAEGMEDGMRVHQLDLGVSYDAGSWFASAEVLRQWGDVLIPEYTSGYVSGGVRVRSWTPYATFATTQAKGFQDAIPTAGIPAMPQFQQLIAGAAMASAEMAAGTQAFNSDQSSLSLGVRWDVRSDIAVKAQYDYVMLPSDSSGTFINLQDGFKLGDDVSLFGLSVEFVF